MPSGASTSGKLQHSAKLHPPQTTCPARPQHPVQTPPNLLRALQGLHLTLQLPIACPGLVTHTLAGLCTLWLSSSASSSGKLQRPAKPHRPHSICPVRPQHPMQTSPNLLHTAETVFDLAVAHGMPRAGHSHTGRALCTMVAECCLLLWKSAQCGKTAAPQPPAQP